MLWAVRDHDISQRRACRLVGVDPKICSARSSTGASYCRAIGSSDNGGPDIRKEMKRIAAKLTTKNMKNPQPPVMNEGVSGNRFHQMEDYHQPSTTNLTKPTKDLGLTIFEFEVPLP